MMTNLFWLCPLFLGEQRLSERTLSNCQIPCHEETVTAEIPGTLCAIGKFYHKTLWEVTASTPIALFRSPRELSHQLCNTAQRVYLMFRSMALASIAFSIPQSHLSISCCLFVPFCHGHHPLFEPWSLHDEACHRRIGHCVDWSCRDPLIL